MNNAIEHKPNLRYVYIVECSDGTLYTGWTTDVDKRIAMHNSGKGAKYTKNRAPVVLKYVEEFRDKHEAQRREAEIKRLSRAEKLKLFQN